MGCLATQVGEDAIYKVWLRAEKQTVQHIEMECQDMAYGGYFEDFRMAAGAAIDYVPSLNVCEI